VAGSYLCVRRQFRRFPTPGRLTTGKCFSLVDTCHFVRNVHIYNYWPLSVFQRLSLIVNYMKRLIYSLITSSYDRCVPTTRLNVTSRQVTCLWTFTTVRYVECPGTRLAGKWSQWPNKYLLNIPEYEYLPNKPIVVTVWQLFTWLLVKVKVKLKFTL